MTAPKPAGGNRTVILVVVIGFAGLFLMMAVGAALLLPALAKAKAKARELAEIEADKSARGSQSAIGLPEFARPLTPEEQEAAKAFAIELAAKVEEGDTEWIRKATDFDAITARAFEGMPVDPRMKSGFRDGVSRSGAGLLQELVGAHIHFHGLREREGQPAVYIRADIPSGGIAFLDILIRPTPRGFRIIDLYNHALGVLATRESGMTMALLSDERTDALGKLLGLKAVDRNTLNNFTSMQRHSQAGESPKVIEYYDRLPEGLRRNRISFGLLIKALQSNLDDKATQDRYLLELEGAQSVYGSGSALLAMDLHVLRGDFGKAAEAAAKTMEAVGRDAHLLQMQGVFELQAGKLPAAERCLAEAETLEPDLASLLDLRLMIRATKGDNAGAVEALRAFEKENGIQLDPASIQGDIYKSLLASPEFRKWAAEPRN